MPNDYFQFQRFTIRQEHCAMKVGTDGTLLGAWAEVPSGARRILDIGTGTGLIALMMAQRFPEAQVVGVEIDTQASAQAKDNVLQSPFSDRVSIMQADVTDWQSEAPFDAIVCNPPFFIDALICPDDRRTTARHSASLSYAILVASVCRLLSPDGCFSVVIPTETRSALETETYLHGLFLSRCCAVKTVERKQPKRFLMEFRKQPVTAPVFSEEVLQTASNTRSHWYQALTADFYLR